MIVWGSKIREVDRGSGDFFCPVCRDDRHYVHQKVSRYFTVNYVPLFQTDQVAEYVRCADCRSEFRPAVLSQPPEQLLSNMHPWICTACQCRNIGVQPVCMACGDLPTHA